MPETHPTHGLHRAQPVATYNPLTERFEPGWRVVGFEAAGIRVQQDHVGSGYYVRRPDHVRPLLAEEVP